MRIAPFFFATLCLAQACSLAPPPPAEPSSPAASGAEAPEETGPSTIEVRVLAVSYGEDANGRNQTRTREQAQARARNLASLAREGTDMGQLVRDYGDAAITTGASPRRITRSDPGFLLSLLPRIGQLQCSRN